VVLPVLEVQWLVREVKGHIELVAGPPVSPRPGAGLQGKPREIVAATVPQCLSALSSLPAQEDMRVALIRRVS